MSLNENSLLLFTAALEELLSGGIPLSKSLKTISETKPLGKKVCIAAYEIFQNLNSGSSFFVSLKKCSQMTGKNDGFSKVARNLEEKSAKRAERFLGLL